MRGSGVDIKEKIEELTAKLKENPKLLSDFQKEPVATLEGLLGVDLPDDKLEKLAEGIKAKLGAEKLGNVLGGLFGKK